ncbi:Proteophosphoglycan ppg4 [Rhodotorula toruloides ATCC 204091]|uniref:Proteophosphoglycan ppg4 n=1 Tax=Rhodotorula toruloides TaxID=5286 RepID=A0A0K3CAY4_RHOTO|nr:Proteophosphoglycan ppg4 [Rhodotorula toruloides ATCC 204091]PRQ75088.1 Proteophosphoglycan ppg4 [Rhodotorula toruloides]
MSGESLSNKIGNATGGTVGEQTLTNEATKLASHTLDYAKGVVGLGKDSGASQADSASTSHGAEGSQTLGGLINEGRDFAAHVLHAASDVIGSGADKAKEAAGDAQKSADGSADQGYVAKARDLAASALQTAEGLIAAGQKKAEEASGTTTDDLKAKTDSAASSLNQKVEESKAGSNDAAASAQGYVAALQKDAKESSAQLGSNLQKQADKATQ